MAHQNFKHIKTFVRNINSISRSIQPIVEQNQLQNVPQETDEIDPRILQLKPTKLPPSPRSKDLLHVYGIRAKSNLSQNFLLNQRTLRSLVRASGISPGHRVVEVGPGPGNLTRAILEKSPFEVIAIEKDRRFLPILEQLADSVLPGQLKILLGDALDYDINNIFGNPVELANQFKLPESLPDYLFNFSKEWTDPKVPPIRLIGNLPFSVSTAMLIKWLGCISRRDSFWQYGRVPMLLTFQDEVARRICAEPVEADRSRLSAMAQNYCYTDYKFKISGKSFTPKAGVNTGVVRLTPRAQPFCQAPFKLFEKFNRHLFHHRHHNIEYNYKTLFPMTMRDSVKNSFIDARVNPRLYPFMISNQEIARLCDQYYKKCQEIPSLIEYDYRASKKLLSETSLKVLKDSGFDLLS